MLGVEFVKKTSKPDRMANCDPEFDLPMVQAAALGCGNSVITFHRRSRDRGEWTGG